MKHFAVQQRVQTVVFTTGDEHLSSGDVVEDVLLPQRVKLGEHIVQQHDGVFPEGVLVDLPFRQLQGQRRRPHLSL